MSKRILGMVGAALLLAIAAYAGDVWKDKDFKEWDQKDVTKIMTDSPWVKKIESGSPGGGGGASGGAPVTDVGHGNLSGTGQGTSDMGSAGGMVGGGRGADPSVGVGAGNKGGGGGGPLGGNYSVTWASSRTMREAVARNKELNGVSPDDARKGLTDTPTGYVIVLRGNNLGAFAHASQDDLVQNSYLELKGTKVKINAIKVLALPEGGRPTQVLFDFPKTTATGEPTIPADEKGANFVTKIGKVELKVTFDLSKMTDKQGPDL
jgi:hypothetical protein